jgi:hypothetical protein
MITIAETSRADHIDYSQGVWQATINYAVTDPASAGQNHGPIANPLLPPEIPLRLSCGLLADPEYSLRYPRYGRSIHGVVTNPVDPSAITSDSLSSVVLPIAMIQARLQDYGGAQFEFTVIITDRVDIGELTATGGLSIDHSIDPRTGEQFLRVQNKVWSQLGPVTIRNFQQPIGDLAKGILWAPRVNSASYIQWHLLIGDGGHLYTNAEYEELLYDALNLSGLAVPERLPEYFALYRGVPRGQPLTVTVALSELPPSIVVTISFWLRFPERELFYPTKVADLDEIVRRLHAELLQRGVRAGRAEAAHQRVLGEILLYRRAFFTVEHFAIPDQVRQSEQAFHDHLHANLATSLTFGVPRVYSEVRAGNSRIDLLIEGVPTELKLERRPTVGTAEIIDSYKRQAADYASRSDSRFGFLVVLDAVPDRADPAPLAEHDVMLVDVPTSSGETVAVIGLIIRLPRSPSDFN